jgi:hypothetical protein
MYVNEFDSDKELVATEDALAYLFKNYPNNQELRYILIKVTALDSLYNTNLRMGGKNAIVKVANHILGIKDIDAKLQRGSPELVDEIALIEIDGKTRNSLSFASKYCHWHHPDFYPIYDSYVDQLLWAYHNQFGFMEFKQAELRKYPRYKEIIEKFRTDYKLAQLSFKELDKFLWGYSKKIFRDEP